MSVCVALCQTSYSLPQTHTNSTCCWISCTPAAAAAAATMKQHVPLAHISLLLTPTALHAASTRSACGACLTKSAAAVVFFCIMPVQQWVPQAQTCAAWAGKLAQVFCCGLSGVQRLDASSEKGVAAQLRHRCCCLLCAWFLLTLLVEAVDATKPGLLLVLSVLLRLCAMS